jgi:hypothetical protein
MVKPVGYFNRILFLEPRQFILPQSNQRFIVQSVALDDGNLGGNLTFEPNDS